MAEQTETGSEQYSLEELAEILGTYEVRQEDVPILTRLVEHWKLQADIGGLSRETADGILHALSVRITAFLPSQRLAKDSPEEYQRLRNFHALAVAEEKIARWALGTRDIIEGKKPRAGLLSDPSSESV